MEGTKSSRGRTNNHRRPTGLTADTAVKSGGPEQKNKTRTAPESTRNPQKKKKRKQQEEKSTTATASATRTAKAAAPIASPAVQKVTELKAFAKLATTKAAAATARTATAATAAATATAHVVTTAVPPKATQLEARSRTAQSASSVTASKGSESAGAGSSPRKPISTESGANPAAATRDPPIKTTILVSRRAHFCRAQCTTVRLEGQEKCLDKLCSLIRAALVVEDQLRRVTAPSMWSHHSKPRRPSQQDDPALRHVFSFLWARDATVTERLVGERTTKLHREILWSELPKFPNADWADAVGDTVKVMFEDEPRAMMSPTVRGRAPPAAERGPAQVAQLLRLVGGATSEDETDVARSWMSGQVLSIALLLLYRRILHSEDDASAITEDRIEAELTARLVDQSASRHVAVGTLAPTHTPTHTNPKKKGRNQKGKKKAL